MPDDKVELVPAEAFPLGEYLAEEMEARGWNSTDVANRMGGKTAREIVKDQLIVELTLAIHDPNLILDEDSGRRMARAFGVDETFFLNLDKAYRDWRASAPSTQR